MSAQADERREAIFDFVSRSHADNGVPATGREIAEATGIPTTAVWHHLNMLVKKGRLSHVRRKYVPAETTTEAPRHPYRPTASCPWGETAHDYAEATQTPLLYCRKCGDLRWLVQAAT